MGINLSLKDNLPVPLGQHVIPEGEDVDSYWMSQALKLAQFAGEKDEVPIGALLVLNNEVIGRGFNQSITLSDPSAHAEVQAIREAGSNIANYRLLNTSLYVTLEPCMMCAGAMVHARIKQLIFASVDPKAGVIVSQEALLHSSFLNHTIDYRSGVLEGPCRQVLVDFFRNKRLK